MGLVKRVSFSQLLNHKYIRFDPKYLETINKIKFHNFTLLKDLFEIINGNSYTNDYVDYKTDKAFIRIGNLSFKDKINPENIIYLNEELQIPKDKLLKKDDLILATIGATIGKINLAREFKGGTFSNNTVVLRLKENNNPLFLEKLLQTNLMQKYIAGVASQKAQPNLQSYDIEQIKIPNIDLKIQNKAIEKIKPIEEEIQTLKTEKKDDLEIINNVFSKELKFDWDKFNSIKKEKIFISNLLEFSKNKDTRFSYNFTHKSHQYLKDFLFSRTSKKIKDFVKEDIKLGKSISPAQFDKTGDCYYVSMATIKNYKIELDDSQLTSKNYEKDNITHKLQQNDIVVSRSGVAIGKFALVDNNINAINADFTIRIRLNEKKVNPLFAYYFFRSDFIQELIHFNKKGLQNKNIFPSQLQEFPLLGFDLDYQQEIVDKIQTQIDSQKNIDKQIKDKQAEISKIIEYCIQKNG